MEERVCRSTRPDASWGSCTAKPVPDGVRTYTHDKLRLGPAKNSAQFRLRRRETGKPLVSRAVQVLESNTSRLDDCHGRLCLVIWNDVALDPRSKGGDRERDHAAEHDLKDP